MLREVWKLAILKPEEIRRMTPEERMKKLEELRREVIRLRGQAKMGGAIPNAGRIKEIRRAIARILTIMREDQLKSEKGER